MTDPEYATGGTLEPHEDQDPGLCSYVQPNQGMSSLKIPQVQKLLAERSIDPATVKTVEHSTSGKFTVGTWTEADGAQVHEACWYCALPPEHRGCPVHRDGNG